MGMGMNIVTSARTWRGPLLAIGLLAPPVDLGSSAGADTTPPPRTIRVPAELPTIQSALDVADNGDSIVVAPGSPAIDAGDPLVLDEISDWHPRWPARVPNGPRSDMGAYGGEGNRGWLAELEVGVIESRHSE